MIAKRSFVLPATFLIALLAASSASAKDRIERIEIKGATLADPIEITDPAIVNAFSIWVGPGVRVNDQPVHLDPDNTAGMFIDWPRGTAGEPPYGMQRFDVTFWLESAPVAKEMHGWYVFVYGYDSAAAGGYIYLPGKNDEGYGRNVSSIYHGVEGHWFHSSSAWEKLVRPIIESRNTWDKAVAIAFPDGATVRLTLHHARVFTRPFPWPDRLIDQYQSLKRLAEAGDSTAAIALHHHLSRCQGAYEDEISLERAIARLHREGILERPDGGVEKNLPRPGGSLLEIENMVLREPFEFCRGITAEQKAELPRWTRLAAEAGDILGLAAWARSLDETEAGLRAWEDAWQHGVRSAPAALAALYESEVPGVVAGGPDYIRAYAFRLIAFKLHEAWYGKRPSRNQGNELLEMEANLRRAGEYPTPERQARAVTLAREMLEQNRNCCTGVWPGLR